jgi:hypothetical protein
MNLNFLQAIPELFNRFWCWFTQNTTPVGILLTLAVNVFTLIALFRTLWAVNRQARAADRQAQAAEQQARASRQQTEVLEQQRIAAEMAAQAAEKQAQAAQSATAVADAQRIATEQAARAAAIRSELTRLDILAKLRPILVITRRTNPNPSLGDIFFAVNHGTGAALAMKIGPRAQNIDRNIGVATNILGPGEGALISMDTVAIKREGIQARYESQDGRHFATVMEPGVDENFLRQDSFETDSKGGWLAQPAIPSTN